MSRNLTSGPLHHIRKAWTLFWMVFHGIFPSCDTSHIASFIPRNKDGISMLIAKYKKLTHSSEIWYFKIYNIWRVNFGKRPRNQDSMYVITKRRGKHIQKCVCKSHLWRVLVYISVFRHALHGHSKFNRTTLPIGLECLGPNSSVTPYTRPTPRVREWQWFGEWFHLDCTLPRVGKRELWLGMMPLNCKYSLITVDSERHVHRCRDDNSVEQVVA